MNKERKGEKIQGQGCPPTFRTRGRGRSGRCRRSGNPSRPTRLDPVALGIRDRFRPPSLSPSPYSSPLTLHRSPLTLRVLRPLGLAPAAVTVRCFYSRRLFS